ncbi:MAG: hypothetical protein HOV79_08065 [Hamadaea sp.]|nr:hypothetical protein [Hamadaea sp.]
MTSPPPTPEQQRSRMWLWIALPLIVVLLSCLGAAGGVLLAKRDAREAAPGGVGVTASPAASASPSARATTVVVRLPATLLGRAKTKDTTLLKSAEQAVKAQRSAESGTPQQILSTYYGSFAKKNLLFVLVVQGKVVDPEHLFATVKAALEAQRKGLKLADIEAGPLGGYAACGDSTVSGGQVASCLWVDAGSYAFIEFFGAKAAAVTTQFVQARGQIEKLTPA